MVVVVVVVVVDVASDDVLVSPCVVDGPVVGESGLDDVDPGSVVDPEADVPGSPESASGDRSVNIARLATTRMAAMAAPAAIGEGPRAGMAASVCTDAGYPADRAKRSPPILGRVTPGLGGGLPSAMMRGLWSRLVDADLSINAAAVAYNAFLALVPLGAALLGLASLFGRDADALASVTSALSVVAPAAVVGFVEDLMVDAGDRVGGGGVWLIVVSILIALALGSRAVAALQKALGAVENRTEARRGVKLRLVATLLTMAAGAALVLTSFLLVIGRRTIAFLVEWTGAGWLEWIGTALRIPFAVGGLFAFLLAFYRWGPPEPLPRAWLAALVGAAGTILASLAFALYLSVSPNLGVTFGVLGAVAAALIWLYLGSMAILLGAVVVAYVLRWRGGMEQGRVEWEHPQMPAQEPGS